MTPGLRVLQLVAGFAVVASLWQPPGSLAAALGLPWFLFALTVALVAMASLWGRTNRSLVQVAVGIACFDLAMGSTWWVLSRAGWRPRALQEPIVLLTAIHFHYSGFATAVIAAAALHLFGSRAERVAPFRIVLGLVLILPFVLAAGFAFSPWLRMAAALGLAVSVTALAGTVAWFSSRAQNPHARVFLRMGSAAAWIAMGLAGAYAVSDHAGRAFLTLPGMASTHGVLNGLGFVLLSTLAFLIELRAVELEGEESARHAAGSDAVSEGLRKRPGRVPRPVPEFVARDFYDQ